MARPKVDVAPEDRASQQARADARAAEAKAAKARAAYRATLRRMSRRYTQASVARALGISPQALSEMLKRR